MDLEALRTEIDGIDTQLTDLFVKRMKIAAQIGQYKKEHNLAVMNQGREREILSRISQQAGEELDSYARILFATLFDLSRTYQEMLMSEASKVSREIAASLKNTPQLFPKEAVVACQGVEGGYTQQACDKVFPLPISCTSATGRGSSPPCRRGCAAMGFSPSRTAPTAASTGYTT